MFGRVLVDGRDEGGGSALTPEVVVTAAHVLRKVKPGSTISFAAPDRDPVAVLSTDIDAGWDLAALHLQTPVPAAYVCAAADGDRWAIPAPAARQDAYLTGRVEVAAREFTNSGGGRQRVVQLAVDQELGNFGGYSGSGVRLPAAGDAVAAILTEQQLSRARRGPGGGPAEATNVLYAVPVAAALERFGLTAAATAQPTLPGDTPINNFLARVLGAPFGGRDDDLGKLDAWAAQPDGPARMLVVAPAGAGKSSLLARWNDRSGPVVFVPISIAFETAERDVFYRILAGRVARAYHEQIALPGRGWDLLLEDLARLLRQPPPGGSLVLVIDGLDEAVGWEPGPNLLPAEVAPGVRIVATARSTAALPEADAWAAQLGWSGYARLPLGRLDRAGIVQALRSRPALAEFRDDPDLDVLAEAIQEQSADGDPLVVGLNVGEVEDHRRAYGRLPDPAARRSVPAGLAGFLDRWWEEQQRQWPATEHDTTRAAFDLLALARGPLTRGDLLALMRAVLTGRTVRGDDRNAALQQLRRLVVPGPGPDSFVLAHPRIGGYRAERLADDGDAAAVEEAYLGWGRGVLAEVAAGRVTPDRIPDYLVRHLGDHLGATGAAPAEMLPLASLEWRLAWDARSETLLGHLRDLRRFREAAVRAVTEAPVAANVRLAVAALIAESDTGRQHDLMSPELVAELLRAGLWSPARALAYAQSLQSADGRAMALTAIVPVLPDGWEQEAGRVLTDAAEALELEYGEAVFAYVRWLAQRHPEQALAFPPQRRPTTFDGLYRAGDARPRVDVMARMALVAGLAAQDPARAARQLQTLLTMTDLGNARLRIARELVRQVPYEVAARLLGDPGRPAAMLAGFLREGAEPTAEAMVLLAGDIALWLPVARRPELLAAALSRVESGRDDESLRDGLVWAGLMEIAAVLPPELIPRALALADRLAPEWRFEVYVQLAEASTGPEVSQFLSAFLPIRRFHLGPHLGAELGAVMRSGLGRAVLDNLRDRHDSERSRIVDLMAPHLDRSLLDEALALAIDDAARGHVDGLRAVLARMGSLGSAAEALARTYPRGLDPYVAAALAASDEEALDRIADPAIRLAVAANLAARDPRRAIESPVFTASDLAAARRAIVDAMPDRHLLEEPVARAVLDSPVGVVRGYVRRLTTRPDGAPMVNRVAQQWGPRDPAVLRACRPHLSDVLCEALTSACTQFSDRTDLTRDGRWSVAAISAALLPPGEASFEHAAWQAVVRLLDGLSARLSTAGAGLFFQCLPPAYLAPARSLVLDGGLLEADADPERSSWASDAAALIDSFDVHDLPRVRQITEKEVGSAGDRDRLRARIGLSYARRGRAAEAIKGVAACGWTVLQANCFAALVPDLPDSALPDWITAVRTGLRTGSNSALREQTLAVAAGRCARLSPHDRRAALAAWLGEPARERREDLAIDATALAVLLFPDGEEQAAAGDLFASDLSLAALRRLTAGGQ